MEEEKVSLKKGNIEVLEPIVEETEPIAVEAVDSFIVEDGQGTHQEFKHSMSDAMGEEFVPVHDKSVHIGIKWLIGLGVVFSGYIGVVTGMILGVCFTKSPYPATVRYGRNLIIGCTIYLIICIILSLLGGILHWVFYLFGVLMELIF
ncbi:MAG: hypothetical protein R3Y53_06365 [Bacillota bacterium]